MGNRDGEDLLLFFPGFLPSSLTSAEIVGLPLLCVFLEIIMVQAKLVVPSAIL